MKNLFFLILCMFLSAYAMGQSSSTKEEEEAVKQLVRDAFEEVWSDLDTTKVRKYHTDDFILLEDGMIWNNDSIKNYQARTLQSNNRPKRNNDFDFVKAEKSGNSIWLAYHNYANWTIDNKIVGEAQWLESAVAIKTENGWKLQMLHSTRVEDQ